MDPFDRLKTLWNVATSGTDSLMSRLSGGHDYTRVFKHCCEFCKLQGNMKEAIGYCSDCRDYLCAECFSTHRRPKPSRHHTLLDQQQMPKDEQQQSLVSLQQTIGVRKTCAHHVMDVRVRSGDSSNTANISGCVFLPGDKLVIVDSYNSNVRLADLIRDDVVSQLDLPGKIWDITRVGTTQVAVTSHNKQTIYFVNVGHDMKLDRNIKVKGQCRGIARISDSLIVVSYDCPVKVEIISMKGILLQTVVTEDDSSDLFSLPWYIAVTKDQQTIYVSDAGTHSVTSVDLAGRVQATYRDAKLRGTLGLTVDTTGIVYVCGNVSNNILQLTADLIEGRELLNESDDVKLPASVCYCEATGKLCIGTYAYDKVKVFQLE